jgi:signal transduction histidine kinase
MKFRNREARPHVAHAVRVAVVSTLLIATVYVAVCVVFDMIDASRLVAEVDAHLADRLVDVSHHESQLGPSSEAVDDHDVDAPPVLLWKVSAGGQVTVLSDGAPRLPPAAWEPSGHPTTATLGAVSFRLRAIRVGGDWLVAAQSLADTAHVQTVVQTAEAIAGPVFVLAVFFGTLAIGLKAAGPVERARRRQLEFTADASHELRTPLSVIDAEVALALRSPREPAQYREVLERVGGESQRLRRIVEDLLWLARFDSEPSPPGEEPVNLSEVADGCAERFGAVADARGIELSVQHESDLVAWISAPPEWIDRLAGVLVDNACRYAGPDGTVAIAVTAQGNRVSFAVEDSGPGIPPEQRSRLFDRFYRATEEGSGSGLGLAIADAVVRFTGGRWRVSDAKLGGAHMEVSWHRSPPRVSGPRSRAGTPGPSGTGQRERTPIVR